MTKTFDELMKMLEDKGAIPDDEATRLIKEHGPLTDDEKKDLAAAIKMKKALTPGGEKKDKEEGEKKAEATEEVSMDDYLNALSVLDSEAASQEEKAKAQKVKEQFESQ
jgi:hypothetical protein